MNSGPSSAASRLARSFGAMLLVGASFLPRNSQAAENIAAPVDPPPAPAKAPDQAHRIRLEHFTLPSISSGGSKHHSPHSIAENLADRHDFIGAVMSEVAIVDQAYKSIQAGRRLNVLGQDSNWDANFAITSRGAVKLTFESRHSPLDQSRLPVIDLYGDFLHEGGSIKLKIKASF